MDAIFNEVHDPINFSSYEDEIVFPSFDEPPTLLNGYHSNENTLDVNFTNSLFSSPILDPPGFRPSLSRDSELNSPDDNDNDNDSDAVTKYVNQILLEGAMDDKPSMFHDPFSLCATEKSSLYDVIVKNYHVPSYQQNQNGDSPDSLFGNSSEYSTSSCTTISSPVDPNWVVDPWGYRPSIGQSDAVDYSSKSPQTSADYFITSDGNLGNTTRQMDGFTSGNLYKNILNDSESMLQFRKGMEEASKFLPTANQFIIDLDKYNLPPKSDENLPKSEKFESEDSVSGSKGRKHLHRLESELEEQRSSKQPAVHKEEVELSEMFDRVLLFNDSNGNPNCCNSNSQVTEAEHSGVKSRSTSGKKRSKNQGNQSESIDLRGLLSSCAQSVAADDRRIAHEQLKQIRQHSSATGDANQRLANIFANGLEARLSGTGNQIYASSKSMRISASEKLKAYQVYMSSCPFKQISICFANNMILHAASKAKTLHIVDFGIIYGFQWPILIQNLSNLPGGPPRLRITGIEHPQPGFRPAELVEETGWRLRRYCERFHVPFEYQAIATQNWETIKMEDLKLVKGEVVAVNSLFRFKNLLDESVVEENPRDAVLNLIREMNPDIFVNSIINGSYSAPFFVTRFREALFHYSSLFDMFEATLTQPCDKDHRLNFEQEFYGREVMNVISCEGPERVERPETYKQWQIRHKRAGFKPVPLDKKNLNELRNKVKRGYHGDFVFDEDGSWMLQGWKGRIVCASSCWVPACMMSLSSAVSCHPSSQSQVN